MYLFNYALILLLKQKINTYLRIYICFGSIFDYLVHF